MKSLIDTVDTFGPLGVVHDDLNPGNILFVPGDNPTRAVIIDFGSAILREEDPDEQWTEAVRFNNDPRGLKVALRMKLGMETVAELNDYLASHSAVV